MTPFEDLWAAANALAAKCGAAAIQTREGGRSAFVLRVPPAPTVVERATAYLARVPPAVSGRDGHSETLWAARAMVRGFGLPVDVAFRILSEHFNPRCEPPWSVPELMRKCLEADRVPFDKPAGWLRDEQPPGVATRPAGESSGPGPVPPAGPFDDTDLANARRFAADHGHRVRFVLDWKRWVVFDGTRWVADPTQVLAEGLAKGTAERMAREAGERVKAAAADLAAAGDDDDATGAAKKALTAATAALLHAKKTQDMRALRRMLDAARSEAGVRVPKGMDVFDRRNDLLNCPNGTVDLWTGVLLPHDPADFLTRLCPTRHAPAAPRAGHLAFLGKVFHGRPGVAGYVRGLSGYAATGETCDHSFHVFHGAGANGKSVLTNLWVHVLGANEHAYCPPAELLVGDDRGRHPTERVGLRGARLVVCSETREDAPLDEAKVKRLTGTDLIDARGMGQDFFFPPTHKAVLATNHRPRLRGTDHGIRRRLRLVPFAVKFWKEADRAADPGGAYDETFRADPGLEDRLKREAEGVLADMVDQAVRFYATGLVLDPPAEVVGATTEYLKAEDLIGQFFDAAVETDDSSKVSASEFYDAFKARAVGEGADETRLPKGKKFGEEARKRYRWDRPHQTVYRVRLTRSAGPQIRGCSQEATQNGRTREDLYRDRRGSADLRTDRSDVETVHEREERAAIGEFGGG